MTDSDKADNTTQPTRDFGSALLRARKASTHSLEEISEHLKIPVPTLEALENSDLDALPAQTFTQGYIRNYAKFLEIHEEEVIDAYNSNFPNPQSEQLRPRVANRDETTSRSPIVMAVTGLLVIGIVAAAIFGGVSYYREKADALETERESINVEEIGGSLDSPSRFSDQHREQDREPVEIRQDARLAEDGSLILDAPETAPDLLAEELAASGSSESPVMDEEVAVVPEGVSQDVLRVEADDGSWMEVRDANNERLFYNMVPSRGERTIIGEAPFSITMGNARTTRIYLNGLEVDLADYIRSNNTASFSVSTEGQNIIFN